MEKEITKLINDNILGQALNNSLGYIFLNKKWYIKNIDMKK